MQEKKLKQQERIPKNLSNYAHYSNLGFQMLIIILAGVFGGMKLDKWLKTDFPVFTVVLSFSSVIFALYYSVKDLIKPKK
jgi:ATP synthase protein I